MNSISYEQWRQYYNRYLYDMFQFFGKSFNEEAFEVFCVVVYEKSNKKISPYLDDPS